MWPNHSLTDLLGITRPIIQAPMAGFTTPELVAAVGSAGGLGSLGCTTLPLDLVRKQVAAVRQASNHPFNLNFFVHVPPVIDPAAVERMRARLKPYFDELGLGDVPAASVPFPSFDDERLRLVLEVRPRVVSFHFGLPAAEAVRAIKQAGSLVLSSATTVAEAKALAGGGADVIVAQGFEAGGHRGTFIDVANAGTVGTMALVPQVVDAVRVPVVAAGGIADGRGLAAALALGAAGAQIGTAFLGCPETAVSSPHRAALRNAKDASTELTRSFTGRPARALRNRFIAEMAAAEALPFPVQATLAGPLGRVADEVVRAEFMPLWSGQSAALMRELPARELVETICDEAQAIMRRA
jgi:nitronate monooxygenase